MSSTKDDQLTGVPTLIDPQTAELWLKANKRNRPLFKKRVDLYSSDMLSGQWGRTHQGIAFYEDGTLADGQHRLAAIVKSGVSLVMNVSHGLTREAGLVLDQHQQRRVTHAIKISGISEWIGKDEAAVISMMMLIELGMQRKVSNSEIIAYGELHREAVQFATSLFGGTKRGLTTATVRASLACAYYTEATSRLKEFAEVIYSGMPQSLDDKAAIIFREYALQNPATGFTQRNETAKRCMKAIKAFCKREKPVWMKTPERFLYSPKDNPVVKS